MSKLHASMGLREIKRVSEATEILDEILPIFYKIKSFRNIQAALITYARCLTEQGHFSAALAKADEDSRLGRQGYGKIDLIDALWFSASLAAKVVGTDNAIARIDEAIKLTEQDVNFHGKIPRMEATKAEILLSAARIDDMTSLSKKLLSETPSDDDEGIGRAWLLRGAAALLRGELRAARDDLDSASIRLHEKRKTSLYRQLLYWRALLAHLDRRDEDAGAFAQELVSAAAEAQDPALQASAQTLVAQTLVQQGQMQQAIQALHQAKALATQTEDPTPMLHVILAEAQMAPVANDGFDANPIPLRQRLVAAIGEAQKLGRRYEETELRLALLFMFRNSRSKVDASSTFVQVVRQARARQFIGILRSARALR